MEYTCTVADDDGLYCRCWCICMYWIAFTTMPLMGVVLLLYVNHCWCCIYNAVVVMTSYVSDWLYDDAIDVSVLLIVVVKYTMSLLWWCCDWLLIVVVMLWLIVEWERSKEIEWSGDAGLLCAVYLLLWWRESDESESERESDIGKVRVKVRGKVRVKVRGKVRVKVRVKVRGA